ncbi:pentatricopeptide repeat-containing protein At1g20230-like [Asparagus officinalis]|uniref:pentatricopeptide repeat-containing protein At1g20230-like n=1 Tax=Asparagus officinalis TaxID=4686 RepID=UPI00098E402A|nr:pentatricopeptide repeat-containing protein At1g20230-like [Asparagus officinalis]
MLQPPLTLSLPSPSPSGPTASSHRRRLPCPRLLPPKQSGNRPPFKPEPGGASLLNPDQARRVLDEIPQPSKKAPFYAQSISTDARSHQWPSVLSSFSSMLSDDARPDKFLIPKVLKACSELRSLSLGSAVHGYMVRIQLHPDVFIGNSLIDMYAKCGDIGSSRVVFDRMEERDVVTWTALLNAYSDAGLLGEAVEVFRSMKESGVRPDLICWNALISGFARNGETDEAMRVLDEMRDCGVRPGVNSWNGVISGCVQNGFFEDALDVFFDMCLRERPNSVTVASVLPACSGLGVLSLGKELHSYVIRSGLKINVYVGGSLIDMYLKSGKREYAERVFSKLEGKSLTIWNEMVAAYVSEDKIVEALGLVESMKEDGFTPDVITYNTVLAGYARNGRKDEAFKLLSEMSQVGPKPNVISMNALISGFHRFGLNDDALELFRDLQSSRNVSIKPNAVSITSVLSVCTDLKLLDSGKEIHGYVLRNDFESNVFVSSALVDMYAKCEDMVSATKTFGAIREKNAVSWNVLMAGHNHNGDPGAALRLFSEMLEQNSAVPNSVTLLIVLLACSSTAAFRLGRELHGYIVKRRPDEYPLTIAGSLIGMYTKCGSIVEARLVFDCTDQKDIAIWNAMISGYAFHGMAKDSINLFKELEESAVDPDHITFTAILSACNQEGLVEQGWKYFNMMEEVYGVTPTLEHFTCMVNILSTAGLLEESMEFIGRMPFEPDACVWATVLKACRLHSNYKIGEKAARALFELEPSNASNYIVLSNIFATAGMWDSSISVRNDMKARGLKVAKTCSWIYTDNKIHSFKAGDRSHSEMERILNAWDKLANTMVKRGYVPQNIIFCQEGEVDPFSCYHTEKIAVCFGIISSRVQTTIRVSKNVRMCMDCHSSMKFISNIVEREIIVADGCFYHHFKEGRCSCRDKW